MIWCDALEELHDWECHGLEDSDGGSCNSTFRQAVLQGDSSDIIWSLLSIRTQLELVVWYFNGCVPRVLVSPLEMKSGSRILTSPWVFCTDEPCCSSLPVLNWIGVLLVVGWPSTGWILRSRSYQHLIDFLTLGSAACESFLQDRAYIWLLYTLCYESIDVKVTPR